MNRAWHRLAGGVRALLTRRRLDDDLDEELRDYFEQSVARNVAAGMTPEDAHRGARAELGSPAAIRDHVRDAGWETALGTIWQDINYGARLMRRSPAFTSIALLVLAIGIGVNTALFSIVNALFFAPLPVNAPEQLAYLYFTTGGPGRPGVMGRDEVEALMSRAHQLADFAVHSRTAMRLSVDGPTGDVPGEIVDGHYFELLGVGAALGRVLGPLDDDPTRTEPAVVISHDLWTRRFQGDAAVVGRRVRGELINGSTELTIVGVMRRGFRGISDPRTPSQFWLTDSGPTSSSVGQPILRLRPGARFESLQSFSMAASQQLRERVRADGNTLINRVFSMHLPPERVATLQYAVYRAVDVRSPFDPDAELVSPSVLIALTTVVTLVLVIATANIAGLLLARGVSRTGEVAVRRALGAGAIRLTRQVFTETVLLSLLGGGVGVAIAALLLGIVKATAPAAFGLDLRLDWRVLGFAVAACLGTGLLVGLAPALQAARVRVLEALSHGIAGTRKARAQLRHWIVIPQVALSLVLLIVAAVHVRALARIELADLGYATDGSLVMLIGRWRPAGWLDAYLQKPSAERKRDSDEEAARARAFTRATLDRVGDVPGVSHVALTDGLPFRQVPSLDPVVARDSPETASAWQTDVSDDYFNAMQIRLLQGRTFDGRDEYGGRPVAVISEGLAHRLFPTGRALGGLIKFDRGGVMRYSAEDRGWLEVIGVVREVNPVLREHGESPRIYTSLGQSSQMSAFNGRVSYLIIRGQGDRAALIRRVKATVTGADPFAEVWSVQTVEQLVGDELYPRRMAAAVLTAAGFVGLVLAVVGLYGVMSYSVAQRQREIGIRATLGASRGELMALVLREGARVMGFGGAVGLVLGILALRFTASLTPGLPLIDMFSFVGVPLVLGLVILAACYLPARRASLVDPIEVLRGA